MNNKNLLSEGGFGCVYHPGFDCKGKLLETKEFVSKIQKYNKSAVNEIKISNILKTVNGYKNYFAIIVKSCPIDVGNIKNSIRNECSLLKKKNDKFILMKLHYITGDLFINYLVHNKNNNENINNIINNYNHLLSAIDIMITKKVVHFDIKNENIMFNTIMKIPIILDFGISIDVNSFNYKSLKDFFYIYAPEYYIWPLEVHYLSYLLNENNEPTPIELLDLVNRYVDNNKTLKIFSSEFKEKFKKSCNNQLLKYNNIKYAERIKLILDFWKTWDNYSLSNVYLRYISYISGSTFTNNSFIVFFSQMLLQNIHPNPKKRLSIFDTIQTFNKFLNDRDFKNMLMYTDIISIISDNTNKDILKNKKFNKNLTKKIYNSYNN